MLTEQRKAHLLTLVARDGRVVARDVARALGLSEDTIRRDLRELAAAGRLTRVHGGALPPSPTHLPLAQRRDRQAGAKARLAAVAVASIRPGMTVFLDGGTTNAAVVACLPAGLTATIATHSPVIAAALEPNDRIDVILIGGRLFRHSMVAVGTDAAAAISRLRVDLFLMGVTGVDAAAGLTTGDYEEAAIKRIIMATATQTVVLATADKIGTASPYRIAGLADIARLVTTSDQPIVAPVPVIRA